MMLTTTLKIFMMFGLHASCYSRVLKLIYKHVRALGVVLGMVPAMFYAMAFGTASGNVHAMAFATTSGNVHVGSLRAIVVVLWMAAEKDLKEELPMVVAMALAMTSATGLATGHQ